MTVPSGTELARPFLPAKDFKLSKSFYEALGFQKLLDSQVAIFGIGASSFILQNYFQKEWAENPMCPPIHLPSSSNPALFPERPQPVTEPAP